MTFERDRLIDHEIETSVRLAHREPRKRKRKRKRSNVVVSVCLYVVPDYYPVPQTNQEQEGPSATSLRKPS